MEEEEEDEDEEEEDEDEAAVDRRRRGEESSRAGEPGLDVIVSATGADVVDDGNVAVVIVGVAIDSETVSREDLDAM